MAYSDMPMQRRLREETGTGIITRLRPNMDLPKAIEPGLTFCCSEGQPLEWLGLIEREQLHWFAVRDPQPLCCWCPQQSSCPREFSFAAADHEIVFGTVPVQSVTGKRLLLQVRSWIEANQSYEKNQLGLGQMYFNSLRFCWTMTLLADTVGLLRAHAMLNANTNKPLLTDLTPTQIPLGLE